MRKQVRWSLGLAAVLAAGTASAQTQAVPVFVDGDRLSGDALLLPSVNRTVVPMRSLFESLGAQVEWDSAERAVYAWRQDGSGVRLPLRELYAQTMEMSEDPGPGHWGRTVSRYSLDAPAQLIDGRVYVPLRFASEALKADVRYAAYKPAVHIRTQRVAGYREEEPDGERDVARERDLQREQELARQRELEAEQKREREQELARQRELELARQRELEQERQLDRDLAAERRRQRGRAVQRDREVGTERLTGLLDLSMLVRSSRFERGKLAPIELIVRNESGRRAVLPFRTEQQFDIEVLRDGEVVWNWAQGRRFQRERTSLTLEPGEDVGFEVLWDLRDNQGNPVRSGEYTVRGTLLTDTGERLTADRTITVGK